MPTATAPTVTPAVAASASIFNVAAQTNGFGVEALASRYLDLLRAGFGGVGFSTVLDAVLDARARGDRTFDVLTVVTTTRTQR
jgi:hypothetical protein